jgi:hypothetical protein
VSGTDLCESDQDCASSSVCGSTLKPTSATPTEVVFALTLVPTDTSCEVKIVSVEHGTATYSVPIDPGTVSLPVCPERLSYVCCCR